MIFKDTINNANRVREIIQILLKYGFDEVVSNTALGRLVPYSTMINPPDGQVQTEARIRGVIEELGPTFVKLAQILSNRPDLIPQRLLAEFEKLQSQVPAFEFEEVQKIIIEETGKPIEETFRYLSQKPVGAASIGQVHKGKLVTGEMVAVKVQRPNIILTIETDISILKYLVKRSERYFYRQGLLNPVEILEIFERTILKELNYLNEARHMEQFRHYYADNQRFYVPLVYTELCTERVLVMEFIYGCKITDVNTLNTWGINTQQIAEAGLDIYLAQIFEHGYFHADPHPGNIIIRNDGTICLIDFGMVGRLTRADKYHLVSIFIGITQQDARRMAVSLQQLALDSEVENAKALEVDLSEIVEEYSVMDVGDTDIAELAQRLQRVFYKYQLKMPPSIYIILRAITILDGVGKTIYPDFQFYTFLQPYGEKILKEQFSFKNLRDNSISTALQLFTILNNLPFDTKEIITQVRKGRLHIQVELQGYEKLLDRLDFITNRISLTLLISALLIGSSIMLRAKMSAGLMLGNGVPIFSLIGFSLAGILIIILIVSILRSGKF